MDTLAAWVATYLIHSTLLIGAVALIGPWLRRRPELASPLWKVALVGGIATATVQVGAGVAPWGGTFALPSPIAGTQPEPMLAEAEVAEPMLAEAVASAAAADDPEFFLGVPEIPVGDSGAAVLAPPVPSGIARAAVVPPPMSPKVPPTSAATPESIDPAQVGRPQPWWATALAWLLPVGLLVALASLVLGMRGLSRRLRGRLLVEQGPLLRLLDHLRERAGSRRRVALSVAPEISIPMATGIVRPEIVVPSRVAEELSFAQAETLLAHELAHVLRFDPAWRVLSLVIGRALFFQPLNRLAIRGMADAAEYLCDDWAARHTKRPLDLARCLTEVAGWGRGAPAMAAAAVDAEVPRSVLGRRVQRLLDARAGSAKGHRAGIAAAGLALVGLVVLAPGVAIGEACDPPPRRASASAFTYVDGERMRIETVHGPDGSVEVVLDGDLDIDEVGEVMLTDDAEAETPRARRKAKRKNKAKAAKARRKAKKDVRQAFRDARRRGSPVPNDAEIAEILRRGQVEGVPPHAAPSRVRLRIVVPRDGEPRVTFESGGGTVELSDAIEEQVEEAMREAERDARRAILESQRAREYAGRDARQSGPGSRAQMERQREHAQQQREHAQRQREHAQQRREHAQQRREHVQRQLEHVQRQREQMERQVERAERQREQAQRQRERMRSDRKRAIVESERAREQADRVRREVERRVQQDMQGGVIDWIDLEADDLGEIVLIATPPPPPPPPAPTKPVQHVRAPSPPSPPTPVVVVPPVPTPPPAPAVVPVTPSDVIQI